MFLFYNIFYTAIRFENIIKENATKFFVLLFDINLSSE